MPLKRSIAALAVAASVSGCGTAMQTQAQAPSRPILQTGDTIAKDHGATRHHGKKRHGKKFMKFLDALAAKDPSIKADLDQLKKRMAGLTREQRLALHSMWWEANKNNTLDQIRLRLQGFLDAPSTFITHLKTNLDKLQAMSTTEVAALAEKHPPSTFKQLKQMMREARKADMEKKGEKGAGALAEDDDDDILDVTAESPEDTGVKAEETRKPDAPMATDAPKTPGTPKTTDAPKTGTSTPATSLTTAGLWNTTTANPYQSPYSWW